MRRTAGLSAGLMLWSSLAFAQRLSIESLSDLEGWKTSARSQLLGQNDGHPFAVGRLRGWMAVRPVPALELLVVGELEGHTGEDAEIEKELEVLSLRWLHSRALIAEGGRILMPIGEFGPRRFSSTNPLIGAPDIYPDSYPWGGQISGAVGPVDYRAALVSLPAVNEHYTPEPGQRIRPVLGLGVSIGPALRLGAAMTHGSYLGPDVQAQLPSGRTWQQYQQTIVTGDARLSVGYVEARFEAAWSSYQVPTAAEPVHGLGWYGELRATLSPRVFVAGRFEHNRYPFVMPVDPSFWVGVATTQMNGEAGVGYRLSPDALFKATIRKDHWPVHTAGGVSFPDGYAFGVQLSLHTNIGELLAKRY